MTPVLRTERLEFLPYRPEHEDAFVALLRNEEVCRWMGQDLVPEPEIRALFQAILTDVYPHNRFDVWGLWLQGTYVGHAEVKKTGNVDGHELVTALVPGHWGRGLGGEVVRGLLRHAADHLGLDEAYGMVGADNTASLTMCRRLGFRHLRDVVADDGSVTKMLVIPTRTETAATPAAHPPQPAAGTPNPVPGTVNVANAVPGAVHVANPVPGAVDVAAAAADPAADTAAGPANPVPGAPDPAAGTVAGATHAVVEAAGTPRAADPV
ncbi:GNAT family N-acetyltransferase [Streptomyces sp. NPDC048514]|uniref:GNAT family N-acetyltransferase n=1 Tax=Streptomyces sp. NPDC048514 TaxID=3365564 RepID=UPI00371D940C